jgi:hypothetical protein
VARQLDSHLPLGEAGLARFRSLARLEALVLGLPLLLGAGKRNRGVLPALLDRVPASERDAALGRVPETSGHEAADAPSALLGVHVEEDAPVVPAHDHALSERLALARLEARLTKPQNEVAGRVLLRELDGEAPVVRH